jgi:hypothetical protein
MDHHSTQFIIHLDTKTRIYTFDGETRLACSIQW